MLELTKKQTTDGYAEFCIRVPQKNAARMYKALSSLLGLTNLPVREINENGEELFALDEIYPERHKGETVRGLRLREELTQAQLAERLGVKQHHISEIENGKRGISPDMARRLAEALGTEYQLFL